MLNTLKQSIQQASKCAKTSKSSAPPPAISYTFSLHTVILNGATCLFLFFMEGFLSTHDIIVIGASAGGLEALTILVHTFPPDLPAAIFVVIHIPPHSPSVIPGILNRSGPLVATHPHDGAIIEHRHIYVAPPDHHLLVEPGRIRVTHGPKAKQYRPAIDSLFLSASQAYGPRVVGVILSGALHDGTDGLLAVKHRGGITVVQDPAEALFPSMPKYALEHAEIDYCLPLSGIGALLGHLAKLPTKEERGSQ